MRHVRLRGVRRQGQDRPRPVRALCVVLVLCVVLAGVGGCGSVGGTSAPSAPSAADSEYLASVHDNAPDIGTYRNDTALVRLGHAACEGFASGASYEQLADRLALQEGADALPSADLGAVIAAATMAFCPRYAGLTTQ